MDANLPTKLIGQVLQAHFNSREELVKKIKEITEGSLTIDASHEIIQLEESLEILDSKIAAIEYTYNYVDLMLKKAIKEEKKLQSA